jgi:hypothetical protein
MCKSVQATKFLMTIMFLLSLGLGGQCFAEDVPVRSEHGSLCLPEHPGTFRLIVDTGEAGAYGLSKTQSKFFLSKIDAILSELRTAKVFNPPLGVRIEAREKFGYSFYCKSDKTCARRAVLGDLELWFLYFTENREGKPVTDIEGRAEAHIFINDPYMLFDGDGVMKLDDGRKVAWMPVLWGQAGGVTVYYNQSRRYLSIFLTKGDRPLWVPVSREQYLTELIRKREADLAKDGRVPHPKAVAGLITPLRSQLEGMTKEEKASQAWVYTPSDINPLVPANTKGARPLVVFNPDYFDTTRPRTDIQLIAVRLRDMPLEGPSSRLIDCDNVAAARIWEFVHQVDWRKIAGMMN